MSNLIKKSWLALLSIGPGLFCIGYTIGTGSVTSMIKAGSQYGMQLLWVLFLSAFFSWALMEAYGRYAAVTGETAIHSFKNRLKGGRFWAVLAIVGVVMGQWSSLSGIVGLTSHALYEVMRLFIPGLQEDNYWAVLLLAALILAGIYMLLLVGRYSFFEKLLVVFVTIMGVSFIISMFIELPPAGMVVKGFVPSIPPGGEMMAAAFVGTTMAAPTFVVRPLIVKEKGWNKDRLKEQSKDALWSATLMFVISACIMVVATGILFGSGKTIDRVLDMVNVLEPVACKFAVALFMFGAMSAGLSSAFPIVMVLPLLIGDYKQGKMDTRSRTFRVLTGVACVVGLTVPVLGTNPIMAQIATQIAAVFILPVVIGGIGVLVNMKKIMGEHRAGLLINTCLALAFVFSLVMSYTGIKGLINFLSN